MNKVHAEQAGVIGPQWPEAAALLRDAANIQVARGAQYDKGQQRERSMARVVAVFNLVYGTSITEYQGWKFMEILKLVRGSNKPHEDSEVDCISYAALAAEARLLEDAPERKQQTQELADAMVRTEPEVSVLHVKMTGADLSNNGYYDVLDAVTGRLYYARLKSKQIPSRQRVLDAVRSNGYGFSDDVQIHYGNGVL